MTRLQIASLVLAPALAVAGLASAARFGAPRADVLPPAVSIAEGLAEDIQADLEARNWTMAETRIAELQKNRLRLRVLLQAPTIAGYQVALDSLRSQLARHDQPAALQSANRMSREIVHIMANYDLKIPVQVSYMDVAGRDAKYAAEGGRWEEAVAAVAELRVNYVAVQSHVTSKNPTLDRQVRQQLNELDAAVTERARTRVGAIATALLENVDLVERTY